MCPPPLFYGRAWIWSRLVLCCIWLHVIDHCSHLERQMKWWSKDELDFSFSCLADIGLIQHSLTAQTAICHQASWRRQKHTASTIFETKTKKSKERRRDAGPKSWVTAYLHGENPTHPNDAEDVEDSRAHDGADPNVPFSDEDTCRRTSLGVEVSLERERSIRGDHSLREF